MGLSATMPSISIATAVMRWTMMMVVVMMASARVPVGVRAISLEIGTAA